MKTTAAQGRWFGAGILTAAAVASVAMGAGQSVADTTPPTPTSITISGTDHYVGTAYTITVHCQVQSTVGVAIDSDPYDGDLLGGRAIAPDANLLATVQWTPTTTGTHVVQAYGCASGAGWPGSRPPTATLAVVVTNPPPASTGSASGSAGIPIIGPLLSKLFG
ncbi:hypothetical protein [Nocardia sp. NPDC056000]|uniref:hypothetical protein n=1 Tax=Nocardia sp. NPDC056000 TaxID=3345674 RepID=UPI0035DF7125